MTKRDEWVRVKDESELRAGMAVELRPCHWCGTKERFLLIQAKAPSPYMRAPEGRVPNDATIGFRVAGNKCNGSGANGPKVFTSAIRDGRLYRLADSQLTDLSESRELENVRG